MSQWWLKADYFESCNCAHGCPCNLTSMPTDGTCTTVSAWSIREGAMGEVRLDGLILGFCVAWPNPIHEGNGRCVVYVDDRADDAQREALGRIGSGLAGPGGPFEIFASTYSEPARVVVGPITLRHEGHNAEIQFGDLARARIAPIKSEMDGSEASARMVLPKGFIWGEAEIVNTEMLECSGEGFDFHAQDSSGFLAQVEYNV